MIQLLNSSNNFLSIDIFHPVVYLLDTLSLQCLVFSYVPSGDMASYYVFWLKMLFSSLLMELTHILLAVNYKITHCHVGLWMKSNGVVILLGVPVSWLLAVETNLV